VRGRAVAADAGAGEGGGALFGVRDVGLVVGAVEVHAVPAALHGSVWMRGMTRGDLRRVQDVRSNASWACLCGESFSVESGVSTWSGIVSAKVWPTVAPEAGLHFHVLTDTIGSIANKHTEPLS
jgi:hypothetical protein